MASSEDNALDMKKVNICAGIDVGCTKSKVIYNKDGKEKFWIIPNKSLGLAEAADIPDAVKAICTKIRERFGLISKAVVVVPAVYSSRKKEDIKRVVSDAGISDVEILSEPEAAVMAYDFPSSENQNILVYDWGEREFQVTIFRQTSQGLKLIAYAADKHLGGHDFTQYLMDEMLDFLFDELNLDMASEKDSGLSHDIFLDNQAALQDGCEKLKKDLSFNETGRLSVVIEDASGQKKSFQHEYTRDEFKDCTTELRSQAKQTLRKALNQAKLKNEDISFIIMAGGTSISPIVQEAVYHYFGKKPYAAKSPMTVSAAGACLHACKSIETLQALPDVSVQALPSHKKKQSTQVQTRPEPPKKKPKTSTTDNHYYMNGKGERVDKNGNKLETQPAMSQSRPSISTQSRITASPIRKEEMFDPDTVAYYEKEAALGNATAQYHLGDCYNYGRGIEKDYWKALDWYKKAAQNGNYAAQKKLKELGVAPSYYATVKKEQPVQTQVKHKAKPQSQTNTSTQPRSTTSSIRNTGTSNPDIEYYKKEAERGNTVAQYHLGDCYYYGKGVEKDYWKAIDWYKKAAQHGNYIAQQRLEKLGFPPSSYAPIKKEQPVQTQTKPKAQTQSRSNISTQARSDAATVRKSNPLNPDTLEDTAEYYKKEAALGNATAQYHLGNCYYYGKGIEKDYWKATDWYKKAAQNGNHAAQQKLKELGYPSAVYSPVHKNEQPIQTQTRPKKKADDNAYGCFAAICFTLAIVVCCFIALPSGYIGKHVIDPICTKIEGFIFTSDLSLNGVELGEDADSLKKLGKPERVVGGNYIYHSIKVGTKGNKIVYLESMSEDAKTKRNIHPGSTGEEMINSYGGDFKSFKYKDLTIYEYSFKETKATGILRFAVDKDAKIKYISVRIP